MNNVTGTTLLGLTARTAYAYGYQTVALGIGVVAAASLKVLQATRPLNPARIEELDVSATPEEIMRNEKEICRQAGELEEKDFYEDLSQPGLAIGAQTVVHTKNASSFEGQGGATTYRQDRVLIAEKSHRTSKINFFGVFDGHGPDGHTIAQYVKTHFAGIFVKNLPPHKSAEQCTETEIYAAIQKTYKDLNARIKHLSYLSGTTASVAIVIGEKMYASNVGDTRLLLLKGNGTFEQCTEDAHLGLNKFNAQYGLSRFGKKIERIANKTSSILSRILGLNQVILRKKTDPRLIPTFKGYGINMASTMGDTCCPQALRDPAIAGPYTLETNDRILGASDGVFDHLTSRQVNTLCKGKKNSEIPEFLAHLSFRIASKRYRHTSQIDNASVVVTNPIINPNDSND
jgi:serine/threonine protein phosphatase PrpC